ncbi:MAG: thiosulfate oxidation carrier protein SoxY [Pseudomonadota bacterium]
MNVTRRSALALSAGAVAALSLGVPFVGVPGATVAVAKGNAVDDAIAKFAGGATPGTGKVSLTTPEIAENGNTVPISFSVESPMTDESYVTSVLVLADGNPNPGVATFNFSKMSGEASAATRVRLAKTQNIIAVAKMSDGTVFMDKKEIKVTIGGCGG